MLSEFIRIFAARLQILTNNIYALHPTVFATNGGIHGQENVHRWSLNTAHTI